MSTTQIKKYFVVSLPRTGTKSLCNMAHTLGFRFTHVPSTRLPALLIENEAQFFADTPIFAPSVFSELSINENHKFIYIDRPINEWLNSLERVKLHNNYMSLHRGRIPENEVNKLDRITLEEIFDNQDYSSKLAKERYMWHQREVIENIPYSRLLVYKFSMGWEHLANFMEVDPPENTPIPKINQNTMFDSIL